MKKLLLVLFALFFISQSANSTHLVGGSLTYEYLGGSNYRISLRMYRAADNCDVHVACAGSVNLDIYTGSGSFIQTVTLPLIQSSPVTPYIDSCAAYPSCVALDQCTYQLVVNNMPPIPGGYFLYHEICCRNSAIININNPLNSGMGFPCEISDNTQVLSNNSPQWTNPPPVFVCQGFDIDFDHSATDAEGDSLVYSFYTPYDDIDYTVNNDLTFTAGNPNLQTVTWNAGFNANNPLDVTNTSNLTIGSDGVIHGIPPALGQYVAGVRCDEYRDGVLIGSIFRDFQFNVVNCPPPIIPEIGESNSCDGDNTVDFVNNSQTGGNPVTYYWDFDINNPGTFTSNQTSPSHNYGTNAACFDVMLVTQPGGVCADTAYRTVCLNLANAEYSYNDTVCVNTPVTFTDNSTVGASNNINSWFWDFDDNTTSILPSPTHTWTTPGTYQVELVIGSAVGCKDSITKTMFVQGLPTANAGPDTTACINNPLVTLDGNVTNSSGGIWLNGLGTYNPNSSTLNTDYTPTGTEVGNGFMYLILATTGNAACPAASDSIRIDFVPGPTVDAGPDQQICKTRDTVYLSGVVTIAGGGVWSHTGTGNLGLPPDQLNNYYLISNADTAVGNVTFYLSTTNNGNCIGKTDTMEVTFFDPPTLTLTADDTTCQREAIQLTANISTGSGYWETLGGGTFFPDSLLNSYYMPGPTDEAAGFVTLIFISTNNGGCREVRDTLNVAVIPSPDPMFTATQECFGTPTAFTNSSTAVGGIQGYEWDFGDGTSTATNPNHTFTTEGTQTVSLIVTSNNGCKDTLVAPVIVDYLPNVAFTNPSPCLQGGTFFDDQTTVNGGGTAIAWDWDFGDGGSNSTVQNPTHQFPSAGTYNVTLTVTTDQGCIDSLTQPAQILPPPVADFTVSSIFNNLFEDITFTDASVPVNSITDWSWDFGDGSMGASTQNTIHNYNAGGHYWVTLIVTDTNGCVDSARKEVIIFIPPLVPSGFTPNGDGTNDVLYVLGGPFSELDYKIYNNWGQIIFESNSQSVGWDGTYKGAPQPIGVYVYVVIAKTEDDVIHELHGDVTLMR